MDPVPVLSYVLCATARSGSNLLCEYLRTSSLAGTPMECFGPARRWRGNQPVASALPAYLRHLKQMTMTPNGVFGFKLLQVRLDPLIEDLHLALDLADASPPVVLEAAFPNVRYAWIRRRNTVRQAISYVRALQTGVWFSTDHGDPDRVPVFDAEAIKEGVRTLRERDAAWQRFFEEHAIDPCPVYYEDLVEDPVEVTKRLLDCLGIAVPDSFGLPSPQLQKQADELTEDWVRRYERLSV
jgi:LPS sulfotransferase NodH